MSITFRIATAADDKGGPIATINARQLAAFRTYLREESVRIGTVLLDPDAAEDDFLSYHFEARVCPLALAAVTTVFDFASDVISVVEEAQFRSRRVSVYRREPTGTIHMRVALTSDLGLELDLASSNAYALLESLGLRPDSVGEIPIDTIRTRLANPTVRRRAAEDGVSGYIERLDKLLAMAATDETCRLEWASLRPIPVDERGRARRWRALFLSVWAKAPRSFRASRLPSATGSSAGAHRSPSEDGIPQSARSPRPEG